MHPLKHKRHSHIWLIAGAVALVAVIGIGWRMHASWALRDETKENAATVVAVAKAASSPTLEEIVLPGNVQAWHEAPIYARTSGYIKEWKTDIGTIVKKDDVLAEIETPEVDAQLRQAEADLNTAEANNLLAQNTAKRWQILLKTGSVSKQEVDEKTSDATAKAAAMASAKANRDRLRDTEAFQRVVAPFDGMITARNTDNGALINAGSGTASGQELFHIADISHLRIYVQVPQNAAAAITPGMTAELHFTDHPGKTYAAKLIKTSGAIDPVSRTLLAQFEFDNSNGELFSGGYTEVHLKLAATNDSIRLPVNALIFRSDGLQVATIDANNHALLKPIAIGRDFGNSVEVVSGLAADEQVIVNPPDSLATGQEVRISAPEIKNAKENKDTKNDDKKSWGCTR